jgi:hypothetical protein
LESLREAGHTRVSHSSHPFQRLWARTVEASRLALYRDCSSQLMIKEFFMLPCRILLGGSVIDDVVNRLCVVELVNDFLLLQRAFSVRGRGLSF